MCVFGGRGGYTLQSSLILSSTLYSNFEFILDRNYFQITTIIKKMKIFFFFQCGRPHLADPIPSPFHNCLLLVDPLTPRCEHPLWMAPWHGSGHVIQATVYQLINPFLTTGLCPYSLKNRFSDLFKGV